MQNLSVVLAHGLHSFELPVQQGSNEEYAHHAERLVHYHQHSFPRSLCYFEANLFISKVIYSFVDWCYCHFMSVVFFCCVFFFQGAIINKCHFTGTRETVYTGVTHIAKEKCIQIYIEVLY